MFSSLGLWLMVFSCGCILVLLFMVMMMSWVGLRCWCVVFSVDVGVMVLYFFGRLVMVESGRLVV